MARGTRLARLFGLNMTNLVYPAGEWVAGEWVAGEWVAGEWVAGEWVAGEWVAGEWAAGEWAAGEWAAGEWAAGEWAAGEWAAGEWAAGGWAAGEWVAGEWAAEILCLLQGNLQNWLYPVACKECGKASECLRTSFVRVRNAKCGIARVIGNIPLPPHSPASPFPCLPIPLPPHSPASPFPCLPPKKRGRS
jgi:hypothetical protein